MVLIYITCKNVAEAKKIGLILVKKRLAACSLVIPRATSFYWWDAKRPLNRARRGGRSNKIEKSKEAVLLVKTLNKKFPQLEREVIKMHSYKAPCILEIPITRVSKNYLAWLRKEI